MVEYVVHPGCQPRRHIPIVRVRQDLIAAGKAHPAIAHRLAGLNMQQSADVAVSLAVDTAIADRANNRRTSQSKPDAMGGQCLGGAGRCENLGLKPMDGVPVLCLRACSKTK